MILGIVFVVVLALFLLGEGGIWKQKKEDRASAICSALWISAILSFFCAWFIAGLCNSRPVNEPVTAKSSLIAVQGGLAKSGNFSLSGDIFYVSGSGRYGDESQFSYYIKDRDGGIMLETVPRYADIKVYEDSAEPYVLKHYLHRTYSQRQRWASWPLPLPLDVGPKLMDKLVQVDLHVPIGSIKPDFNVRVYQNTVAQTADSSP